MVRTGWVLGLLLALLGAGGSAAHAGVRTATVTLWGPESGWPEEVLGYVANGHYELDPETQQEVLAGSATVTTSYSWSYAPATLVGGGGPGDNTLSVKYGAAAAPGEYVVAVTFTVKLKVENTTTTATAQASKNVRLRERTLLSISSAKSAICAGARANAAHQTWISGQVTDGFGDPVAGASVRFRIVDQQYVQAPAVLSVDAGGGQPDLVVTSDANGLARVLLTSSDQEGAVTVEATGQWAEAAPCSCEVQVALPIFCASPAEAVVAVGRSRFLTETLSLGDAPVPSHQLHFLVNEGASWGGSV